MIGVTVFAVILSLVIWRFIIQPYWPWDWRGQRKNVNLKRRPWDWQ